MELEMDFLTARSSYKCRFCTKVCASLRLVSQVHMIVGQNIKKKLMCQISIKMLKQHAIPNSSLHNFKIYSSAILNIQIFSRRYYFRLLVLLQLVNTFIINTDEYYPMCYKIKWMPRPLKTLYVIYYAYLC